MEGADEVIEMCTKGSHMVRAEGGLRFYTRNTRGANYEGVDGKRNTFMHCVLWYIASCDIRDAIPDTTLRAFIYIDDGSLSVEVPSDKKVECAEIIKKCLFSNYVKYGFKLAILKTVVSDIYMQFLNEIYFQGMHVGYGFRALCHTGAMPFPDIASVSEELAVMEGGVTGSAVSGGNPLRLLIGYHYIQWLYKKGVVGKMGRVFNDCSPLAYATSLAISTDKGGFGVANFTKLMSNLEGNRDIAKHDRARAILRMCKALQLPHTPLIKELMLSKMLTNV
jgi:hypothetical protein